MLKIGLLGYGKMGQAIEAIAEGQSVEIVWRIRRDNLHTLTPDLLRQADVVIEFSRPEAAFDNVMACLKADVPVVCGTTGWVKALPETMEYCRQNGGAFLWASNFSIGVNIFFALNRYLAGLMQAREEYRPDITEIHHIHKLDAPSGTAVTLAGDLLNQAPRFELHFLSDGSRPPGESEVPVTAIREGEVPGTHIIRWKSAIDEIKIEHQAYSRAGFAWGALAAAIWIKGRQGVFDMGDVLGIG